MVMSHARVQNRVNKPSKMPFSRRLFLQSMFCVAASLCWTGCGKHEAASAEEKPASQPHAANGEVTLGPDAPELKQMSVEPVKTVAIAADEVTAPAKIEVNPNRV